MRDDLCPLACVVRAVEKGALLAAAAVATASSPACAITDRGMRGSKAREDKCRVARRTPACTGAAGDEPRASAVQRQIILAATTNVLPPSKKHKYF